MASLRRSLAINFFSSSGATLVQFIVSILIARLLTPGEIGVFSMAQAFVSIAQIFRDFGVSTYLQREADLTPQKIRAAIGVMFASSWLLALILFLISGFIAQWFEQPDMSSIMKVLAIGFLFIPFGAITNALLTREFAADKQALVIIAGTGTYFITSISLAYHGFGAISLAWANLANILACAIAFAPLRPQGVPWLPSFRGWRQVAHFGAGTLLSNCMTALNNALPDVLLGKLTDARHVGLFSRANSTVSIFTYIAGATANYGSTSYLAQAYHRGESLTPLLSRATAMLTGVGWPALVLTALLGEKIVLTLYGPKWLDCVPAIPAMAAAAAVSMMFNYTPIAITALGRPYLSALPVACTALMRVAVAVLLFKGGLSDFAGIILMATLAAVPAMLYLQKKYLNYCFAAMLRAVLPSAVVSFACSVMCKLLLAILPASLPPAIVLALLSLPLAAVWYAALRMTKHPLIGEVNQFAVKVSAKLL